MGLQALVADLDYPALSVRSPVVWCHWPHDQISSMSDSGAILGAMKVSRMSTRLVLLRPVSDTGGSSEAAGTAGLDPRTRL